MSSMSKYFVTLYSMSSMSKYFVTLYALVTLYERYHYGAYTQLRLEQTDR